VRVCHALPSEHLFAAVLVPVDSYFVSGSVGTPSSFLGLTFEVRFGDFSLQLSVLEVLYPLLQLLTR